MGPPAEADSTIAKIRSQNRLCHFEGTPESERLSWRYPRIDFCDFRKYLVPLKFRVATQYSTGLYHLEIIKIIWVRKF